MTFKPVVLCLWLVVMATVKTQGFAPNPTSSEGGGTWNCQLASMFQKLGLWGYMSRSTDQGHILASNLLGTCQGWCSMCPPENTLSVTRDVYGCPCNQTLCAQNCDASDIQCDDQSNCICPPPAEVDGCARGQECDECDPRYVSQLFGWKVCCRGCLPQAVSFSLDSTVSPPRPVCSCQAQDAPNEAPPLGVWDP